MKLRLTRPPRAKTRVVGCTSELRRAQRHVGTLRLVDEKAASRDLRAIHVGALFQDAAEGFARSVRPVTEAAGKYPVEPVDGQGRAIGIRGDWHRRAIRR